MLSILPRNLTSFIEINPVHLLCGIRAEIDVEILSEMEGSLAERNSRYDLHAACISSICGGVQISWREGMNLEPATE